MKIKKILAVLLSVTMITVCMVQVVSAQVAPDKSCLVRSISFDTSKWVQSVGGFRSGNSGVDTNTVLEDTGDSLYGNACRIKVTNSDGPYEVDGMWFYAPPLTNEFVLSFDVYPMQTDINLPLQLYTQDDKTIETITFGREGYLGITKSSGYYDDPKPGNEEFFNYVSYEANKWYSLDLVFNKEKQEIRFFANAKLVGTSSFSCDIDQNIFAKVLIDASGAEVSENSGFYFDNMRILKVSDGCFFASYDTISADSDEIRLSLSETPANFDASKISVNRISDGTNVTIGTPVLSGKIVSIPLNETLNYGEYAIDLTNLVGITGDEIADGYVIIKINSRVLIDNKFDIDEFRYKQTGIIPWAGFKDGEDTHYIDAPISWYGGDNPNCGVQWADDCLRLTAGSGRGVVGVNFDTPITENCRVEFDVIPVSDNPTWGLGIAPTLANNSSFDLSAATTSGATGGSNVPRDYAGNIQYVFVGTGGSMGLGHDNNLLVNGAERGNATSVETTTGTKYHIALDFNFNYTAGDGSNRTAVTSYIDGVNKGLTRLSTYNTTRDSYGYNISRLFFYMGANSIIKVDNFKVSTANLPMATLTARDSSTGDVYYPGQEIPVTANTLNVSFDGVDEITYTGDDTEVLLSSSNVEITDSNDNPVEFEVTNNSINFTEALIHCKTYKWYNIKALFSLDTRRLHVYVDGIEVLADNELYMCKSTDTINFDKIYNIYNENDEAVFYLDNIKGYRDILAENLALDSGKLTENLASGTLKTTILDSESTDVAVIWTSDDSAILSAEGVLGAARVNKYPTLQATVDDINGRATRRYTFYVPGVAGIYENKTGVTEDLNDLTFVTKENGKIVTWTSSHPEIITSTGKVTRPQETTTVTMTATCDGVAKAFTIEVLGLREANSVIVTANDLTVSGKTATYSPRVYNSTAEEAYITPILAVYNKATDILENIIVKPTITVASESYSTDETVALAIPDGGEYYVKGFLWDKINSSKPYISARTEAKTENAKMFIISDSTYAHYNTNSRNQAGIGMFLGNYFNDKMTVVNHAVGGSSSRSWLTLEDASGEKFKQVLDAANSGDYMLISFGINDKTNRDIRYVAIDEMDDYLSIYVQAAKDRGITPILVTSILAAQYTTEGGNVTSIEYESAVEDRRVAVRNYAATAGVELVDLSAEQKTYFDETYGAESSAYNDIKAFYIEEADGKTMVHFHNDSANIMAGMLAKLLKSANIDGLGRFFKN